MRLDEGRGSVAYRSDVKGLPGFFERRRWGLNYVWVLLLALPAVLPLLQSGYLDSHDGLFHLYRLAALDEAFKGGVFNPRWFPDFAFGYGHPVLNYYSPLTYFVAQLFHMVGVGNLGDHGHTFLLPELVQQIVALFFQALEAERRGSRLEDASSQERGPAFTGHLGRLKQLFLTLHRARAGDDGQARSSYDHIPYIELALLVLELL